ncbi:MAG: amidohydrolase [Candidatus Bipolaricaulia bacterium]
MSILLDDFTAITLADGRDPVEHISIAIEGGEIQAIGSPDTFDRGVFGRVLDGEDKLVMPGFVNAHTHLPMVLLRGYADDLPLKPWLEEKIWPVEAELRAAGTETIYWGALLGIAEMIRSGTTACADMYYHMDQVARAVKESGVRALLSWGIIAPEIDEQVERQLETAADFVNEWDGAAGGRIATALSPHAPYTCDAEVWRRAVELAEADGVRIHTHLAETAGEVEDAYRNWGVSPVRYLEDLGVFTTSVLAAHCVHVSDEDIERLVAHGVHVVHNPGSNLKLASGIAPVERMLEAGIPVALGTDGAASNNNLDMLEEIRLASLLQKVEHQDPTAVSALEALRMGTVHGAMALGFDGIGVLEAGGPADLIIVDLDQVHMVPNYNLISNLVYAGQSGDVETVIVNGQIVMEARKILTFDEAQVKRRVRQLSKRYRDRSAGGGNEFKDVSQRAQSGID